VREVTKQWTSVEIDVFDGLLVITPARGAGVMCAESARFSDYEYALAAGLMNRTLEPRLGGIS